MLANNAISAEEAEARKAQAEVAKAALDSAKLDLEYTEVRAPIDGRVSRALLTEGNYVSGNAGSASLLTTMVSVNPVYVYADIDEDTLLKFNELVDSKKLGNTDDGKIPVELELADESEFSAPRATSSRSTTSSTRTPAAFCCARFFRMTTAASCRDCSRASAFR